MADAKFLYASGKDSNALYVTGVYIPDPYFFLDMGEKQYIFLDHREFGVFVDHNKNLRIELVLSNPLIEEAQKMDIDTGMENKLALLILSKYDLLGKPIAVPANFPLSMADFLRAHGAVLEVMYSLYPARLEKSTEEVAHIREALKRTQLAYGRIEDILKAASIEGDVVMYEDLPLTSECLKVAAEQVLLEQDMLNVEGIVISCGEHAAIPHHQGKGYIRPHQTIVCDIFPRHRESGYFADMTRTYVKGTPSDMVVRMYEAVQEAQQLGMSLVKPGVVGKDIHAAVQQVFLDRGFHIGDKGFIHGTGHGLGLDIHELPYINNSHTNILSAGNVVTVEPGLYYAEHGGVRIEDVVVVTADGAENLTQYPTDNWIIS